MFGVQHLGTLFGVCFLSHQAGSFLGAYVYIGELCRQFQELLDQYESFEISLTAGVREAAIT
jgi:hypothetical protein